MNTMIKMFTVLMILNIFMYLGVNFAITADNTEGLNPDYNFHFENDLIEQFLSSNIDVDEMTEGYKDNWTDYAINFSGGIDKVPTKDTAEVSGTGFVAFLDSLGIVWEFVGTLFNLIVSPLTLFFNFGMPFYIGLLIGVPYFMILLLTVFAFIRGVGD